MRKHKQTHCSRRWTRPLDLEVLENRYLLSYTVTDLGFIHEANGLNDTGQVVGFGAPFDGSPGRGYLWDQGVLTDLGELGGASGSRPSAINNAGQIVGRSGGRAFLWQDGVISDLGTLPTASAINNAGQVVGSSFLWQDGTTTNLGDLGGGGTTANAINDASLVVGSSFLARGDVTLHAFVWQDGKMTDLGAAPGDRDSDATAINSAGAIVGLTGLLNDDDPAPRAFLYDGGTWTVFAPVGSAALGINDSGQVVGVMPGAGGPVPRRAFVSDGVVLTDLNTVIPADSGIFLEAATAINNYGQIVGLGWSSDGRHRRGFLLTPEEGQAPRRVEPAVFRLAVAVPIGQIMNQAPASAPHELAPLETAATLRTNAAVRQAMDAVFASSHRLHSAGSFAAVECGEWTPEQSLEIGFILST